MRFQTTPAFDADYSTLPDEHKRLFRERIAEFSTGCDRWITDGPNSVPWPARLRVHRLANTAIWSMTWHYRRPDGRATFEFVQICGHSAVRWRRIGGHEIYDD